ncbi:hypothetical protein Bca4012_035387 [Brassica carinata]|uniref:Uncharacterized protein n=1 Tax=Brassica carinata TaxID=52824 RepID=A0A8X8B8V2_BRACI|nr:hypothetical protein Bca52824_009168 [Brassica carinata]
MGVESNHTYSKSGNMDKVSTPPGFVSQTTFVLKNLRQDRESSRSVPPGQEQITGFRLDDASFKLSLNSRPWIVHDHTNPTSEALKPIKPEVHERRIQRVSKNVALEEAPVFNPTEEEFSDTLSYIASLRDKAEPYGICCVVPPTSWKPPCLLEEKEIWEVSKFDTQVQLFDANGTMIKKEESDDDHTSENVKFCRVERGPRKTLETFKNFADSYKKRHFSVDDEVLGSKSSSTPSLKPEPTVADVEKEYRQLVESPLVEIEVLYGNDLDTRTFSSGFPLPGPPSESCNYKTSGWNLNNTAKLPGSLLSFEDCESVGVPRLSVGMFLSSQLWKSEKDRLYSLCYLHMGAPRVWYSVAGCHRSKVMNLFPEMSGEQQLKMSREPVMIMSPYALNMEGIPVTRCVQNPGQYVILFPGSCYSAVNCGFNCLEKANFAPIDWLPHGDVAAHQNQEKKKKSLISYDKILMGAAREAVRCLKENSLSKKKTAENMRWFNSCGREGLFTSIVKSRVKQEKSRREFLASSLKSQRMDKSFDDGVSKRECCFCFVDLHLSAVQCSCSDERYSCLSHVKNLCACPSGKKSFLYRYTIDELNILVEALELQKLSSMFRWGNFDRNYYASSSSPAVKSSQPGGDKGKKTDEVVVPCSNNNDNNTRKDVEAGGKEQGKTKVKARSIMEIMKGNDDDDDESGPVRPCSNKQNKTCDGGSVVNTAKKPKQG